MPKKTRGLGRGLDALLPESTDLEAGLQQIAIGEIDPNPDQPRRTFDEESITALAASIREQGVLQPILVTPTDGGRYRIVAGERRWRASRKAGLTTVPCVVRELDILMQMEIALIENLQREDLNPMDEAAGIRSLMRQCGYTQETAAARLGMSRPAVANLLRLLNLPADMQEAVRTGALSAGHARVLAGVESSARQRLLFVQATERGWSVRQLEEEAARLKKGQEKPAAPAHLHKMPAELAELEDRFRTAMGVRTTLTGTVKKGRIVLSYNTREELEHIHELLTRLEND